MTHAFSVRMPIVGNAEIAPVNSMKLARMQDQGWLLSQPVPGMDAAISGIAGCHYAADWLVFGLACLEDRDAVAAQLGLSSKQLETKSDLELLHDLRVAQGPDFARDTAGSFSVVCFNCTTGAFEAYRDHLGIFPLYYTVCGGALTCASDLRSCLHLSGAKIAADSQRIADFVHGNDIDLDRTAFETVFRLAPAHRLLPSGDGVNVERYWQLKTPAPYAGRDGPADLRQALAQATGASTGSVGVVGAMLSGGLDSSTLAGMAAEKSGTPLQTLSFVYGQDKSYDETPYIDAAIEAFGAIPHKITIEAGVALDALGPVIEEQMDLFLAPGLAKSRQIYAQGRALGLDAMLDGHGGDEVISHGYGRLVELAAARQFWRLFREAKGAAQVHGVPLLSLVASHIARYGGLRPGHPLRRVLMKVARVLSRGSLVSGRSGNWSDLIAPKLRASFDVKTRYARDPLLKTKADFNSADRIIHLASLTDPLIVQSFEVLHRSATAAGILPRYPFLDSRVVSLCLSLPSDLKLRDGRSRWVLREALRGVLPDKIRLRADKAEYGSEVQATVLAFFRNTSAKIFQPLDAFVDVTAAEQLRVGVVSGKVTDVGAVRALWRLAILIQWVTAFSRWRDMQEKGALI